MTLRRTMALATAGLLVAFGLHHWAAGALIDHGIAGALLAGGGGLGSILLAASFMLLRVVGTLVLALLPAAILAIRTRRGS
ncbi:MAG: hypothetical protein AAF799_30600 [Myxococcota bacterium]